MSEGWRMVDEFTRHLTLAVRVTDEVTGGQPVGDPEVRVRGVDEQPTRNPSGFSLFFDLPEEELTVTVDGGDLYHDASEPVDLDPSSPGGARDPGNAVEVSLSPTPVYPFSEGLTRVRGTLLDGSSPVPGADISVVGNSRTTRTTDAGEFVYYFDDITPTEIAHVDIDGDGGDERVYKPGGSDPAFEASAGGSLGRITRSVTVEVGRLTTQDLNYTVGQRP